VLQRFAQDFLASTGAAANVPANSEAA
jgi:hypothetical protein